MQKHTIALILAFMVCGALNWGYAYVLGFALIVFCSPVRKRQILQEIFTNLTRSPSLWILFAFGATYVIFGGFTFKNIQNILVLPLVAYMIGWCAFEQSGADSAALRDCILGITLGFAVHAALNYFANIGIEERWMHSDFWSGEYQLTTGSGILITFILSLLFYFIGFEKRPRVRLTFIVLSVICILYMFMLGNRTQPLILVICLVGIGTLYLFEYKAWYKLKKIGIGAGIFLLLFAFIYFVNLFGIADAVNSSTLVSRFTEKSALSESSFERIGLFIEGIANLFSHPFGGQKEHYYFHNMWLDINRIAGCIPLILMLTYNVMTFLKAFRLFRDKRIDTGTRYMILSIYVACLINCFFEPVLEGLVSFFLSFCVINGLTDSMYAHTYPSAEDALPTDGGMS